MRPGIWQISVGFVIPGFTTLARLLLQAKNGDIWSTCRQMDGGLRMENLEIRPCKKPEHRILLEMYGDFAILNFPERK